MHFRKIVVLGCVVAGVPALAVAQLPLAPLARSGQSVTPVYEGWYRNADGSFSLSFGYYNRNTSEPVEIPIGADNFISPGDSSQGQPTRFEARRHWGVFAVRVPANFGSGKVTWTLRMLGQTFAIPGSLHPDWEIDALTGEAGSGNTPPILKLLYASTATETTYAQGPAGVTVGPLEIAVGQPLTLTVWASDDGRTAGSVASAGRGNTPVALAWFKHQGPGAVTFSEPVPRPNGTTGEAATTATFDTPGMYVLRIRANDSGVAGAGHAQCCWTNGFVRVTVTK